MPRGELVHGASGYRRGCRCEKCRAGQRDKQAQRRKAGRSGAGSGSAGALVPPGPLAASAGPLEAKVAAEIEELAGLSPWTRECARLEEQAILASRIVDKCMTDGRLHLTTPQHKIIRDALGELRRLLAPVRDDPGRRDLRTQAEVAADDFVGGLTAYPAVRKPGGGWMTVAELENG